ncbi:unnamed protein product [Rhizophagus irregularis]|uniref:F-box domain-containing protein n=1 Tax=Rhizophagus irregularis TaxID=588596 RepID=A0A2N1MV16_9GLOM|nr:hypothetical protein RhiirC2_853546 [Rhizophagus irregularis]CAB4387453.1 unnamed protein product [Rhizophagus irregularis]CAB5375009.1 unnamed protein product [Rhizophagus irregularis]
MTCRLSSDCLNEILEYLEEDRTTLHSCLLVNRSWCRISVRILWREFCDYHGVIYEQRQASSILSTLIACLPNESKELLKKNKIFISTPTSNPPLFNYAGFCRDLSISRIEMLVSTVFEDKPSDNSFLLIVKNLFLPFREKRKIKKTILVVNEIIKMLANQIFSLRKLVFRYLHHYNLDNSFPYFPDYFPGARNLSELQCSTHIPSNFFYQLSQICHNLQSILIYFYYDVPDELKELIYLQNNLKNLTLVIYNSNWTNIIPALISCSHTVTKFKLYGLINNIPLSFISSFTNLQESIFSFFDGVVVIDFTDLLYANFPKLQILKFPDSNPKPEHVTKFLENNGKNLKKFYISENNRILSLSVANFCPNLRSLFIIFSEIDILRTILISCLYLESITIWCGKSYHEYLSEKEVLETIANHSPNNFYELKIREFFDSDVLPEDLESFFISWNNRTPKKLLSLIIFDVNNNNYNRSCLENEENRKIMEKYENLGIVKFRTKSYYDEFVDQGSFFSL